MAERLTPNHGEREHGPNPKDLEQLAHKPEHSAEKIAEENDRAAQAEKQAEQKIEHLSKSEKKEAHETKPETVEKQPKKRFSKREQQQAFNTEIKEIQQHLKPTARAFSRLVHNPVVETASQALEETVFRPSFLTGGAIGAIVFGGALYIVAKVVGFPLAGSEFVVGVLIGGLVGVAVELLAKMFRRGKNHP